jgi:hypothetical protein
MLSSLCRFAGGWPIVSNSFQKVGLLNSRAGATSKIFPEPHKNDAAPEHCLYYQHLQFQS